MFIILLALGLVMFAGSLVLESTGKPGVGTIPPSGATAINTLRLGGLLAVTVGLSAVLIEAAIGGAY